MSLVEALRTGEKDVQLLYRTASIAGLEIIKVVATRSIQSAFSIVGFDVFDSFDREISPDEIGTAVSVPITTGSLWIYPDENSIGWGYVLGTDDNKRRLASQIRFGRIRVADPSYTKEINAIAVDNGWPLSPLEKPVEAVRKSVKEKKLESELGERETAITALQTLVRKQEQMIAELMKKLPKAESPDNLSFASDEAVTEAPDEVPTGDIFGPDPVPTKTTTVASPDKGGFRKTATRR